jgi:polysaccharide export outer membrane protein
MRAIRLLMLLLGVAIASAGCAQRPVAYMPYSSPTSAVAYPSTASGIDNVVYGGGAQYASPPTAGPYAAAPYRPAPYAAAPAAGPIYAAAPYAPAPNTAPQYAPVPVAAAPSSAVYAYAGPNANGAPAAASDGRYTLDSGDRLRIVVFGQEGLTNAYLVDAGGSIDMPLIGSVMARGATTDQLADRISAKLRDGYIRDPHVAVEIESYRPFFILGEVTAPGQYPYVANMTVETAVAIAGGFTPRALRKNVVLNRSYNGRAMRIAVPLTFPLRPGDTLSVQERWF